LIAVNNIQWRMQTFKLASLQFSPVSCYFLHLRLKCSALSWILLFSLHGRLNNLYSASHSRVAPENVGLQKEHKFHTFAFIPVLKCGCVFWEFAKRKLVTRKDKIR
jgi:hypothetical protein